MSVLKSKRKESKFEVFHNFYKLRKELTELVYRRFGYKGEDTYKLWFINNEAQSVLKDLADAQRYITIANSIYPNCLMECDERRKHQDLAIGLLYDLLQELQFKIDSNTQWLLNLILKDFEVDVSYMSDTEYSNCMHTCYNSIESPICNQGKRYMPKSVNIGDQTSQIIGIYYPHRIDNYIKIVRGIKYYGRYMDDSYIISNDKKLLNDILKNVISIADELGIFINKKKTQIYKLSKGFRFLQNYYALTETGRVIIKIKPKRLTSMRRKMKRIAVKIINGQLTADVLTELFKSWYNNYYSIMSGKQRDNICKLYNTLTEKIKDAAHSKR